MLAISAMFTVCDVPFCVFVPLLHVVSLVEHQADTSNYEIGKMTYVHSLKIRVVSVWYARGFWDLICWRRWRSS